MNSKPKQLGTRVVLLRPGVVLAPDGGAFQLITRAFGRGLVAPVTPATQWCSWIHIADAVELISSALDSEQARGPLNLTSPKTRCATASSRRPSTNRGLMRRRPPPAAPKKLGGQ